MPTMTFKDFDEFSQALTGVAVQCLATSRPHVDWWLHVESVGSMVIQEVQTGGPAVFVGDGKDRTITIGVPSSGVEGIRIDGCALTDNAFMLVNVGHPFAVGAQRSMRWMGVTVPSLHPQLPSDLLNARSLRWRDRRESHLEADLRHILAARSLISRLLCANFDLLDHTAARAGEEELLAIVSCLLEQSPASGCGRAGRPPYSRSRVLAKALSVIEAQQGKPLFVAELCRAAQVSERTLRTIFHEYFGVGPMRLLKVIRLCEIRSALMSAELKEESVWKTAARFGVWDLSAFARDYKALFGELPHQTLRSSHVPKRKSDVVNTSWVRYASRKLMQASSTPRV